MRSWPSADFSVVNGYALLGNNGMKYISTGEDIRPKYLTWILIKFFLNQNRGFLKDRELRNNISLFNSIHKKETMMLMLRIKFASISQKDIGDIALPKGKFTESQITNCKVLFYFYFLFYHVWKIIKLIFKK